MARPGLRRFTEPDLARELSREILKYGRDEAEGPLGIPPDQTALVGLAADRIAPAIARKLGFDPSNEEVLDTVGGYLLGVWARALVALDRPAVEMIVAKRRGGNSDT